MSLSFGVSPLLLVPAVIVAALLSLWLYHRTTPELRTRTRIFLGVLRFASLLLILLLLLEPVLRMIDREERRPILAVLVDNSQSLLLTSSEDSTSAAMQDRISGVLDDLPADLQGADVYFYTFDDEVSPNGLTSSPIDSLTFDGGRTNIAEALDQVREQLRDENLAAALLLSDGQYNTGRNPLYIAERYPVPIYTAVLGDTTRHRDIQIRRVTTNDIAYVDTELPVQIGVRTEDMGGERVTVSILRDGSVISSESATLPDGSTEITLDLAITPEEEGLHRYNVIVSRLDGEVTYRNNRESFTVRVLRSQRRILLVGAAPDPDVSAATQLLGSDQSFELVTFVQKSPGSFYEGAFPSDLSDFDLIVLAGYPSLAASGDVMSRIATAAEDGTPLFFLLTRSTDPALLGSAFADVLPIQPDRIRPGFVEAQFAPTPVGSSHPLLRIPSASPEMWLRLPPLLSSQTRWQASPDAEILAQSVVRGVELDDPMLVIRRRSENRTAALLGAGTWRWRNVPEDLQQVEQFWPSLFSNAVQWLTAREDDRPVRVLPVRDLFGGGESVQMAGQVYDESLNPVGQASVEVKISAPDGTVSPYIMNPIGNGRYTLDAGAFPEGTYDYNAVATLDGKTLGSDTGSFAVGALTLEFKETRANAPLMRQIAQRSGGEFVELANAGTFSTRIASAPTFSSVVVEHDSEIELRRRYIFLVIIIALLTTEWFFRKRSGMV